MIAQDVQRKIWMAILLGGVGLGVLFMIWAVFLNRGTILVKAKSPYTMVIEGLRTENCSTDECSTVVAPGNYTFTIQKQGYRSVTKNITVPFGTPYQDAITLQFIPVIGEAGKDTEADFMDNSVLTDDEKKSLNIPESTRIYADETGKFFSYLIRNPENFHQTLYLTGRNETGQLTKPQIATSFLRDLEKFTIAPSSSGKKIAVIDQAPDQSTLYVVDMEAKNRASLLNYPVIRNMKWLPLSDDFLFEAKEKSDTAESVFLYRWDDGKTTKLELKTELTAVAPVSKNRIIAVTNQKLPEGSSVSSLEGQLVLLGENQSTIEVSAGVRTIKTPLYLFVDYSLISNQGRLITSISSDPFPEKITAATGGKAVNFLQGDKVFQLKFEE
ncbi:MAG: hypothetical protein U0519_03430 [Candidatus Gracilibacteria bacterium]